MTSDTTGSFRLFRAFGINVYLHWTWFLLAFVVYYLGVFADPLWSLAIFITLFAIVLLHEFGHALACKSVGGKANRIVLWPLGGIAFVRPPERPGAMLWTIAAGPLVNVLLIPVTLAIFMAVAGNPLAFGFNTASDLERFVFAIASMNVGLLLFNLLPIYPLDGGQIFQALLWFVIGRVKSLQVAATIGLVLAIFGGLFALFAMERIWLTLIAVFVGMEALNGLRMAKALAAQEAWRM
ncbi:MAG: M50 family metallopeptidase [Phycisphaeraceae bacterium]